MGGGKQAKELWGRKRDSVWTWILVRVCMGEGRRKVRSCNKGVPYCAEDYRAVGVKVSVTVTVTVTARVRRAVEHCAALNSTPLYGIRRTRQGMT